jgi:hypothetical protein
MPQVQGYLEIMDANYCDLVSYTTKGTTIFRIYRDRQYWNLLFPALEEFHDFLLNAEDDDPPPDLHPNTALLKELSEYRQLISISISPQLFLQFVLFR